MNNHLPPARCRRGADHARADALVGPQPGLGEARAAGDPAVHPGDGALDRRVRHHRDLGALARRVAHRARRHARRRHRGRRAVRRRIPADLSGAAIHRARAARRCSSTRRRSSSRSARASCSARSCAPCNGSGCCARSRDSSWRSACRMRRATAGNCIGDIMMVGAGAAWGATTLVIKATQSAQRRRPRRCSPISSRVSIPMLALGMLLDGRAHDRHAERVRRSAGSPTRRSGW